METKKKVFTKNGTLFFLNLGEHQKRNTFFPGSSRDLRLDALQSQIIGGDADVDHTKIIGGDTFKLLRRIYPPPPGFGTPVLAKFYITYTEFALLALNSLFALPPSFFFFKICKIITNNLRRVLKAQKHRIKR